MTTHPPAAPTATPATHEAGPAIHPDVKKAAETAAAVHAEQEKVKHRIDDLMVKIRHLAPNTASAAATADQAAMVAEANTLATEAAAADTKIHELVAAVEDLKKKQEHAEHDKGSDNTAVTIGVGTVAAATAGAGFIESIPLLNKIPYLAEAAGGIQSGLFWLAKTLGIETGTPLAANGFLASLPTWAGPTAVGAIGIPTGLWMIGKMKQWVTREKYEGITQPIKEAAKIPVQLVGMPFKILHKVMMEGPAKVGEAFSGLWKHVGKPVKEFVWDKGIKPAIKPTGVGIGGAALGAILAAQFGTPYTPAVLAGYGIMNYLKNRKILGGASAASSAGSHEHH